MRTEHDPAPQIGPLARGIAALAALGQRYPWTLVVLLLLSCGASLLFTFTHLTYHTSRNDLIAQNKDYLQRWQQYIAEFGEDEDMVVVVRGTDRAAMQAALEDLAQGIQKHPEHFDRLFYKVDLGPLRDRALLLLPNEDIRHIHEEVKGMRMLLDPPGLGQLNPLFGWEALTLQQLLNKADRDVFAQINAEGSPAAQPFLKQLANICDSAANTLDNPSAYRNPWMSLLPATPEQQESLEKPRYFFSQDGAIAFLLARPIFREAGSFTSEQVCIDKLRGLIEETKGRFPHLEFGLTGLPVLENDEMLASQSDSQRSSGYALFGVALLFLLVYRGVRYPLMTVGSLLLGTVWALGWLTLTVGHLNILSSAFAVMLIGMGDYGVLWVARYQQECKGGLDVAAAMRETALHVGPSILTAACTTALAFFAAMLADLKAVAELGWIAGSGVLLCALACFLGMPPLLTLFGGNPAQAKKDIIPWDEVRERKGAWLPWLVSRPRWVIVGTLVLVALLGWQATRVYYDHNLLHLQAQDLDSVRWERTLLEHTTGSSWHALSYTTTREEALALKKKFEQLPMVSKVEEVASLVPLDQERKLEQVSDIHERLQRLPEKGRAITQTPPDIDAVRSAAERLRESLRRLAAAHPGFAQGGLDGKLEVLIARLQRHPLAPRADDAGNHSVSPRQTLNSRSELTTLLQTFQQRLSADLLFDLHRLRQVATPQPLDVNDVPASLRERFLGQNGKWLLRVYSKESLWDFEPLQRFVAQVATVDPDATGKPFTTLEGLKAMQSGFLWAGVYALIAMLLVLLLDFGNVKHLLLALAPLLLGIAATLGVMGLCGWPLNPANLIAFPLILGVGADNGVHVVHDYRQRSRSKRYLLDNATGRGIFIAALTTVLGFGTLMLAHHEGLASLGKVLALGVTCCMAASLVFLPCLLGLLSVRPKEWQQVTIPFSKTWAA